MAQTDSGGGGCSSLTTNFFDSDVAVVAQWDKKWKEELREQQRAKRQRKAERKLERQSERTPSSRRKKQKDEPAPLFIQASDNDSLADDHSGSNSEDGIKLQRQKKQRRTMRSGAFSDTDNLKSTIKDDNEVPRVPLNPLNAAYDAKSYKFSKRKTSDNGGGDDEEEEEVWDHDKFRERSLSPERPAPSEAFDIRRGNWKARAGGVYIPPEEETDNNNNEGGPSPPAVVTAAQSDFHKRRYWTNS